MNPCTARNHARSFRPRQRRGQSRSADPDLRMGNSLHCCRDDGSGKKAVKQHKIQNTIAGRSLLVRWTDGCKALADLKSRSGFLGSLPQSRREAGDPQPLVAFWASLSIFWGSPRRLFRRSWAPMMCPAPPKWAWRGPDGFRCAQIPQSHLVIAASENNGSSLASSLWQPSWPKSSGPP